MKIRQASVLLNSGLPRCGEADEFQSNSWNIEGVKMRKSSFLLLLTAVCAFVLMPASPSRADNLYGTIRGVVTDQSGAVVPGAAVRATDVGTSVSRQTTTSSNGSFEILNLLAPATYNVSIKKGGFQEFISSQIRLNVNQIYVVNAALQVGSITQQITVQANTAQINTTSMQLGTTITGKQIVDLPLNGRD